MPKSTFFTGQPVFNQLLSMIPRSFVQKLSKELSCDRYCKTFHSYDHLVTMLYSSFHCCNSLREVTTGMLVASNKLLHLGLNKPARRSTLSDANKRRPAAFFERLYHQLYHHYYGSLPDSLKGKSILNRLFIIDSTIITLFVSIIQSTGCYGLNGKKKGGIKANMMVRAKDNLPCLIQLSPGKQSDSKFMDGLHLPPGSIIVMDKGYRKYKQLIDWTNQQVSWVNRLHGRAVYKPLSSLYVDKEQLSNGVQQDSLIELGNPDTAHINAIQKARLIRFYDSVNQRELTFITNNFELTAIAIADIYKKRWQIELIFKKIKQNFQLHTFLGDNENAIRIQLWVTLIADLIIKIIKDKVDNKRKWSMANLSSIIRLHLGTYIDIFRFLGNPEKALLNYKDPNTSVQLHLFDLTIRGA